MAAVPARRRNLTAKKSLSAFNRYSLRSFRLPCLLPPQPILGSAQERCIQPLGRITVAESQVGAVIRLLLFVVPLVLAGYLYRSHTNVKPHFPVIAGCCSACR
jgi:hypothetical protein